jgi:hypothetical protein
MAKIIESRIIIYYVSSTGVQTRLCHTFDETEKQALDRFVDLNNLHKTWAYYAQKVGEAIQVKNIKSKFEHDYYPKFVNQ